LPPVLKLEPVQRVGMPAAKRRPGVLQLTVELPLRRRVDGRPVPVEERVHERVDGRRPVRRRDEVAMPKRSDLVHLRLQERARIRLAFAARAERLPTRSSGFVAPPGRRATAAASVPGAGQAAGSLRLLGRRRMKSLISLRVLGPSSTCTISFPPSRSTNLRRSRRTSGQEEGGLFQPPSSCPASRSAKR
jgi:hypothetical protein